jgi:voltage-gated potassium channel
LIAKLQEMNTAYLRTAYDIIMALLAMTIIASLFLQSRSDLTDEQLSLIKQADLTVWLIFVADYIVRFVLAKDKFLFFKKNIVDLISILPFDMAFQGLRAVRVLRLFYMFRVFIYLNRLYKRLDAILTMNNFHHMIWFTFVIIFSGAIAISYIEDMEIGDALWWSFVTTTTVGYGDIAPASTGGRLVAAFLMIVGIGFLSTLTSTISTYFISKPVTTSYQDEALQQIVKKIEDFPHLSIDDINDMHSVLIALKNKER